MKEGKKSPIEIAERMLRILNGDEHIMLQITLKSEKTGREYQLSSKGLDNPMLTVWFEGIAVANCSYDNKLGIDYLINSADDFLDKLNP